MPRTLAPATICSACGHPPPLDAQELPTRAQVHKINGFSASADQAELLAWHKQTHARRTFLVHGEEGVTRQFASHLADTRIERPTLNDAFSFVAIANRLYSPHRRHGAIVLSLVLNLHRE